MILVLFELDVSIMNFFMLQEHYWIYLTYEQPKEDSRGACQGEWNLDFCGYGMKRQQESLLHLDFFISSIARQGIPYVVTGWCKHWVEQGDLPKHHQVRAAQSYNQDSNITMSRCDRVYSRKSWSSTSINPELWRKNCALLRNFSDQLDVSPQGS